MVTQTAPSSVHVTRSFTSLHSLLGVAVSQTLPSVQATPSPQVFSAVQVKSLCDQTSLVSFSATHLVSSAIQATHAPSRQTGRSAFAAQSVSVSHAPVPPLQTLTTASSQRFAPCSYSVVSPSMVHFTGSTQASTSASPSVFLPQSSPSAHATSTSHAPSALHLNIVGLLSLLASSSHLMASASHFSGSMVGSTQAREASSSDIGPQTLPVALPSASTAQSVSTVASTASVASSGMVHFTILAPSQISLSAAMDFFVPSASSYSAQYLTSGSRTHASTASSPSPSLPQIMKSSAQFFTTLPSSPQVVRTLSTQPGTHSSAAATQAAFPASSVPQIMPSSQGSPLTQLPSASQLYSVGVLSLSASASHFTASASHFSLSPETQAALPASSVPQTMPSSQASPLTHLPSAQLNIVALPSFSASASHFTASASHSATVPFSLQLFEVRSHVCAELQGVAFHWPFTH